MKSRSSRKIRWCGLAGIFSFKFFRVPLFYKVSHRLTQTTTDKSATTSRALPRPIRGSILIPPACWWSLILPLKKIRVCLCVSVANLIVQNLCFSEFPRHSQFNPHCCKLLFDNCFPSAICFGIGRARVGNPSDGHLQIGQNNPGAFFRKKSHTDHIARR